MVRKIKHDFLFLNDGCVLLNPVKCQNKLLLILKLSNSRYESFKMSTINQGYEQGRFLLPWLLPFIVCLNLYHQSLFQIGYRKNVYLFLHALAITSISEEKCVKIKPFSCACCCRILNPKPVTRMVK